MAHINEAFINQIKMGNMTQHPLMHQLEKTWHFGFSFG
jgi:hypothetical protein